MNLPELSGVVPSALLTLSMGVLSCFLGYELRKVWAALGGLVFGFLFTNSILSSFMDAGTAALIALGVGIALLLLGIWLYDAGIFILCGGCAALLAVTVAGSAGLAWYWLLGVALLAFVVVGWLSLRFVKPVLILSTAFSGAGSIVSALSSLGIPYIASVGNAGLICTLLFAIAGIVVQFSTARGR